jgi:RNA polymerase sigma-70 factor (ECF subfamily)
MVGAVDDATRLLIAARDGDDAAFEGVVRLTQPDVWRFCAYLSSPAEADDLTQDCYLRAYRSMGRYRGESSARSWLLAIARHTAADHVRAAQRRRRLLARLRPAPDQPDASGEVALHDLVAQLGPERRAAFVLTQILGFSYADAATICACEVGTIRSRVARARQDLIEADRLPGAVSQ